MTSICTQLIKGSHCLFRLATALPDICCDVTNGLNQLPDELMGKQALSEIGMKQKYVDKAAKLVYSALHSNPRQLEKEELREITLMLGW